MTIEFVGWKRQACVRRPKRMRIWGEFTWHDRQLNKSCSEAVSIQYSTHVCISNDGGHRRWVNWTAHGFMHVSFFAKSVDGRDGNSYVSCLCPGPGYARCLLHVACASTWQIHALTCLLALRYSSVPPNRCNMRAPDEAWLLISSNLANYKRSLQLPISEEFV
jgi:hypothetical protein